MNEIADIVGGGTPSTHNPSYWDGDINWYAPAEMEGKRYAVTSERKITQAGLSNSSAKILPAGRTILFTSRAGIGKVAILQHDAATNQGFQSLVLKDGISPYFIYSMGSILKKKAEGIASGSTFLEISGKMLGNIDITIPISSEQHIIADFFRNLDDLITLHQRECFFSRIRKKLKITSQKTNAWEQRKLGDIAIFNPKSELPEKFEYVDLESVVGTEIIAHREEQKSTAPSRAQRLAQFGDLFYQTVRPYQKNNCLFESHCKSYVFSTGYAQIRPFFNGYFLLSLVQSDFFVKRVLDRCTGTSYPAINSNDLAEMSIKKPCDKKEIEKIGQFFRSLDRLITLHQRERLFLILEEILC